LLPGLDSNQQPADYTYPELSSRGGLSHRRKLEAIRWGALRFKDEPTPLRDSLCTFSDQEKEKIRAWLRIVLDSLENL